jgi:hypothetical protein
MHRDELILYEIVLGTAALRICAKLSQIQKKPVTKVRRPPGRCVRAANREP